MKHNRRQFGWLLLTISLIFVLAGCQANASPSSAEKTSTAASVAVVETPAIAQPTPTTPYVLEGATTTTSGLQYLEVKAGSGDAPKPGNIIVMHYSALLPDGTVLYDTHTGDEPITVTWGREQLLAGWEEGVGLMKAGGQAVLVLPPELAFGAQGSGMVPPNSQLVIELELVSVKPAPVPAEISADQLLTTETGLQYSDLTLGEGAEAITQSIVSTHYAIWVQAETEATFIVSSEGVDPVTFVVGKGDTVFPGWEQGVIGMKTGGKRLLVVPPALALGEESNGAIPANATLVMEIELVKITAPPTQTVVAEGDYVTTDSGMKYYDIQVGTGVTPTIGQTVVVHYTGWLVDGTQFDSSLMRDEPFSFQIGLGDVIAGWDEGVASMQVGGKRQLVIPPELAYGDSGAGSLIPPGATLIFEVELLEIIP